MQEQGTGWQWCGAPQGRGQQTDGRQVPRPLAVTVAKWKVLSPGWRCPGAARARSAFLCGYFKPWKPPPGFWPRSGHEIPAPKFPLLLSARHRWAVVSTACPPRCADPQEQVSPAAAPAVCGVAPGTLPKEHRVSPLCAAAGVPPGTHRRWGWGRASALRPPGWPGHAGDVLGTCWGRAGDAYSLSLPHQV